METETVDFRGGKVRKTWYVAWDAGWKNPTGSIPWQFEDEADAYEQGQIERRRDDLMEGTF